MPPNESEALKDLTPTELREKLKAVIVNIDDLAEQAARDSAERTLTASKESMRGVSGFFKRIWTHTLAREYYRQKHVSQARGAIREKEDLYATEVGSAVKEGAHEQTATALVNRFASEYDEMVHRGESRRKIGDRLEDEHARSEAGSLKHEIRSLMSDYASGKIGDDDFTEAKKQILHTVSRSEGSKEDAMYADNLLEIARQVKQAIEHGQKLEELDLDLDVVLGKARSSIQTEAEYNAVDRAIEFAKKTSLGVLVNESTLAAGVATAYGLATGLGRRVAVSRLAAWGTFGASAVVGGGVIGFAENKRLKEDRRQHAREIAQGRSYDREKSPRREGMDKYLYEMKEAGQLSSSIRESIYTKNAEGKQETRELSAVEITQALEKLADAEARIRLMDREKIDLLEYTSPAQVEQERLDLDLARAQAKVDLRKMQAAGDLPGGQSADDLLEKLVGERMTGLAEGAGGIEERDQLFNKMKRRKVARAAVKGMGIGLVAGGVAQEVGAFFTDQQTGLIEHLVEGSNADHGAMVHTTALEGLRRLIAGTLPHHPGALHETVVNGNHFQLPEGLSAKVDGHGGFELMRGHDVIANNLHFSPDGSVSAESAKVLAEHGITTTESMSQVAGEAHATVTANEYLAHHENLGTHVSRGLWYDNDTPKPIFDKNELKLWWGGHGNAGIDEHGNVVFSIKHMMPGGSYHHGLSANAQKLMKEGHLKMLLSLSRGTQAHPVELAIQTDGTIHIDPNSEIGKLFFTEQGGHAHFLGRFAEVAQTTGVRDGTDQVNILATYEGNGVNHLHEVIHTVKNVPKTVFTEPTDYAVDPPPIIPIYGRRPLEPTNGIKPPNPFMAFYGSGGSGAPLTPEAARKYWKEMSPRLRNNPDATLDARTEGQDYLSRQAPEYLKKVDELSTQAEPMSAECKLAVCIPVAGHQEVNNIERTLSAYLHQDADPGSFELVLLVNQPDVSPKGEHIKPDGTLKKIEEFKKAHPELNIRVMQTVLPRSEARIGYIRKLLSDATLQRSMKRKTNEELIMVSNDADLKGVAPEYVSNFIRRFKKEPKTDAFMGQLDWDPESYIRNPLVHVGTRLFQYISVQHRKARRGIESSGANFAYRSSIYASVGGYNAHVRMGEDNDFGRKLLLARRGATNRTPIAYGGARVSRLYTSSRRAEKAIKDGLSPIEQWQRGFGVFDDEVRKVKWEDIGEAPDYDNPEVVAKLTSQLESIINRTLAVSSNWWSHGPYAAYQRRALGWLGIKYKLVAPNRIQITDASELIAGLKQYSKDGLEIMARKTGEEFQRAPTGR